MGYFDVIGSRSVEKAHLAKSIKEMKFQAVHRCLTRMTGFQEILLEIECDFLHKQCRSIPPINSVFSMH